MNKKMQSFINQQYSNLRVNCLFDNNPYKILDISPDADISLIHESFRQKATLLHDIELLGSQDETEVSSVWQGLVDAYNILNDPKRRLEYDQNKITTEYYHDIDDRRYHNQIEVSDVKNLLKDTPISGKKGLDLTLVAIIISFLIAFETVFLIIFAGDRRLSIYFLNAACLLLVASVEYFIWKRSSYKPSDESNSLWFNFFMDPLGLKEEILKKKSTEWTSRDFEYIALFNKMTCEEYENNLLPEDQKYYDIFKLSIENQYQALEQQDGRNNIENHSFYKTLDIHKKYNAFLQRPENQYLIWGSVVKSEMDNLLNSIPKDYRNKIKEALYRLYYHTQLNRSPK